MNTAEIASRLVDYCRRGDYTAAHKDLYAADAVSIEPGGTPENSMKGLDALAEKSRMFSETFEVHGNTVSDPQVAGPFFSCVMAVDVTNRKSGARFTLEEIGVYEVHGGKIVREQFFYPPMD